MDLGNDSSSTPEEIIRKWNSLEHNGPLLRPPYKPSKIRILYDKKEIELSEKAEEVASFYAKIDDNLKNETFKTNFFDDWKKVMTAKERETITDFSKCEFTNMSNYFKRKRQFEASSEQVKQKERKLKEHYGFCHVDGLKTEIGTFRVEPAGIFLGRGEHPKNGSVKKRIEAEDIIINCSSGQEPEPPEGHEWKKIVHCQSSMWLAKWTDDVLRKTKYIRLKAGLNDEQKYDKASKLCGVITEIRDEYFKDMNSEKDIIRKRGVALYLIEEFGFRAGNEKNDEVDTDEVDTVGCCSLRIEHVQLEEEKIAIFDFVGKSSIHYYNKICVDEKVFENLQSFRENKPKNHLLFKGLRPCKLNKYLDKKLPGLTVKVFRTWNASFVFEKFLEVFTDPKSSDDEKVKCYKCANLAVAIFLNHRTSEKQSETKKEQMIELKKDIHEIIRELKKSDRVKRDDPKIKTLLQNLKKLLLSKNKEILLRSSKDNYLDPRITKAWCANQGIPIERVFTRTQMKDFAWAKGNKNYRFARRQGLRDTFGNA